MTIKLRLYDFADDLAILTANLWIAVQILCQPLALFEAAAHLIIKPVKSVIVQLWLNPDLKDSSRRMVALFSQAWGTCKVCVEAAFLGSKIGPLATTDRWANPFWAFASRGYFLAQLLGPDG